MGEPYYPEKHKAGSCNDGQCKLCQDELEDEVNEEDEAEAEAQMDRQAEYAVDEAIIERKEREGK